MDQQPVYEPSHVFQMTELHYGSQDDRPGLAGLLIPGRRGRLLAALYTAAGPGPHPTVLLFHGIPGVERNLDLIQELRRAGFHVLIFHYSGSWGSDGDYSIAHDLEDAETVLDYVRNDTRFDFDRTRIFGIGHSLGAYIQGWLASRRRELRAGVLLMPFDVGLAARLKTEDPAAYQALAAEFDGAAGWLSGTSGAALMREAEQSRFSLASAAKELSEVPLLCIIGSLDTAAPGQVYATPFCEAVAAEGGTLLQTEVYPTDHVFSDYRLTVADRIIRFFSETADL